MPLPSITPEQAYEWKVRLFFAGSFFFLVGVFLDRKPLVIAAIVVLAAAVLIRFLDPSRRKRKEIDPSWYEEEAKRDD
ncbi:MAG TPA: hypothetical protein VE913_15960 [Longimicrobium sp.]|nr:hypothetical protein [Longimicrobium sp.]